MGLSFPGLFPFAAVRPGSEMTDKYQLLYLVDHELMTVRPGLATFPPGLGPHNKTTIATIATIATKATQATNAAKAAKATKADNKSRF